MSLPHPSRSYKPSGATARVARAGRANGFRWFPTRPWPQAISSTLRRRPTRGKVRSRGLGIRGRVFHHPRPARPVQDSNKRPDGTAAARWPHCRLARPLYACRLELVRPPFASCPAGRPVAAQTRAAHHLSGCPHACAVLGSPAIVSGWDGRSRPSVYRSWRACRCRFSRRAFSIPLRRCFRWRAGCFGQYGYAARVPAHARKVSWHLLACRTDVGRRPWLGVLRRPPVAVVALADTAGWHQRSYPR